MTEKSIDELYEALTIERSFEEPFYPPWGGWAADSRFRWCHSTWQNHSGNKPKDIVYRNNEGKKHRIYGPAWVSRAYDFEVWCKNGVIHRDDGPAIRHRNNYLYYQEGKLHRLDGPAIVELGGPREYYINGAKYSPKQYKWEIARRKRRGLIK